MTVEFDHVRASFAASGPGRLIANVTRSLEAAWRTSQVRAVLGRIVATEPHQGAPQWIRPVAIAIVVAAAMQPLLIAVMPLTVRPVMPAYVFATIALLAAIAAWRHDLVQTAWRGSSLARWLRR
jgi:hypothetical protein